LTPLLIISIIRVTSGAVRFVAECFKEGSQMANAVGKRYRCTKCGAEFIVTKGGNGTLVCCGQPMEIKK
jgi:desulfoferrodoxin-like iron-binding protein